jgi:stage 0 sporulation protein B (sporulation initiation phosphotransferase)
MMLRGLTLWGLAALLSLAIPTATIFVWDHSWYTLFLFVVWTFGVVALLLTLERRKHREQCDRLLTHAQVSAIRTLSHHRHDWMNELQILYGYLRLNKLDKAVDIVDRIRVRMDEDSKVSQLGIPELATFFLSFRTVCDSMRLEVEIENGLYLDRLPFPTDKLSRTVMGLVNIIRYRAINSIGGEQDNVLRLFMRHSDNGMSITMAYEGELAAADSVRLELEKCLEGLGKLDSVDELTEKMKEKRTIVVHFPLPA